MTQNGKGSRQRPLSISREDFMTEYERIFYHVPPVTDTPDTSKKKSPIPETHPNDH